MLFHNGHNKTNIVPLSEWVTSILTQIVLIVSAPATKSPSLRPASRASSAPSRRLATAASSIAPSTTQTRGSVSQTRLTASTTGSSTRTERFSETRTSVSVSILILIKLLTLFSSVLSKIFILF